MPGLESQAREFLTLKRLAVTGVSRSGRATGNVLYKRLKATGHEVFPLNPNASIVEGDRCYPDLKSIPGGVEGVVIASRPAVAEEIVRQCPDRGVKMVWMHRFIGPGSVSEEAVRICKEHGIGVIADACPMMFCGRVDPAHRFGCWILKLTGRLRA